MISVIIPVYNGKDTLLRCVESVFGGGYGNVEIILVDDGSTDGSAKLCDKLSADVRIKTLHKQNGGASSARNAGIAQARGEYIMFADCDDTLEPDTLARVGSAVEETHADMVIFGMRFDYYRKGRLERSDVLSYPKDGVMNREQMKAEFKPLFGHNSLSSVCNKAFLRDMVIKNGVLFNEKLRLYEDLDFTLRFLMYADSSFFISKPLYNYYIDGDAREISRLAAPEGVVVNADAIAESIMALKADETEADTAQLGGAYDVAHSVYMQLGFRYLLLKSARMNDIKRLCKAYSGSESLKKLNTRRTGKSERSRFEAYVENDKYAAIRLLVLRKRFRRSLRSLINPILSMIRK